jgi:hypothetical protein
VSPQFSEGLRALTERQHLNTTDVLTLLHSTDAAALLSQEDCSSSGGSGGSSICRPLVSPSEAADPEAAHVESSRCAWRQLQAAMQDPRHASYHAQVVDSILVPVRLCCECECECACECAHPELGTDGSMGCTGMSCVCGCVGREGTCARACVGQRAGWRCCTYPRASLCVLWGCA